MMGSGDPKKVLVFGVGVIGACLTHALAEAGNEVTVLVREERARMLNENGLRIWHHLQKKETVDKVEAVSSIEGRRFDAAFVIMPWHRMRAALPQVCAIQTDLLVPVGNDLSAQEFHTFSPKKKYQKELYIRSKRQQFQGFAPGNETELFI